jgi:hypothetical protein
MKIYCKYLPLLVGFSLFFGLNGSLADKKKSVPLADKALFGNAQRSGRLGDDRLVECSGIDTSLAAGNLIWAINDNGHGPFIYALRIDGRSMGRVLVVGAQNRDWEGLDTFLWQGRPMILIADFGDNQQQHDTHTLYIVEEPKLEGEGFSESSTVKLAWRIVFSYPDHKHDAEAVSVDAAGGKVLILTKRDNPPLLFELPLIPSDDPIVAKKTAAVRQIPPPSGEDLLHKYGKYRSQPTALDLSPDGRQAVVLTYKHAYIFNRESLDSWAAALSGQPQTIPLPLPQDRSDFRQREAICFVAGGRALLITSEGHGAGIFRLETR